MPKLRVHKPFVFTDSKNVETLYRPGEHEVSDEVVSHWWIAAGADGRVETPDERVARVAREAEDAARQAEVDDFVRRRSEQEIAAAQTRAESAARTGAAEQAAAVARAAAVAQDVGKALQSPTRKK